jgi:hypothetical protein
MKWSADQARVGFAAGINRIMQLEAEVTRLRAALLAVEQADCCGCSVYANIARRALDGKDE